MSFKTTGWGSLKNYLTNSYDSRITLLVISCQGVLNDPLSFSLWEVDLSPHPSLNVIPNWQLPTKNALASSSGVSLGTQSTPKEGHMPSSNWPAQTPCHIAVRAHGTVVRCFHSTVGSMIQWVLLTLLSLWLSSYLSGLSKYGERFILLFLFCICACLSACVTHTCSIHESRKGATDP